MKHIIVPSRIKDKEKFGSWNDQMFGCVVELATKDKLAGRKESADYFPSLENARVVVLNPSLSEDHELSFSKHLSGSDWVIWVHFGDRNSRSYRRWEIDGDWRDEKVVGKTVRKLFGEFQPAGVYPYSMYADCRDPWDLAVREMMNAVSTNEEFDVESDLVSKLDEAYGKAQSHFDLPLLEIVEYAFPVYLILKEKMAHPGAEFDWSSVLEGMNEERVITFLERWNDEAVGKIVSLSREEADDIRAWREWMLSRAREKNKNFSSRSLEETVENVVTGFETLVKVMQRHERRCQ